MDIKERINKFKPQHEYFIGIDSDGTAFDSMGIKHSVAFIPAAIKIWGLEPIREQYTYAAELINLYSVRRGINRFPGQLMIFDYLSEHVSNFVLPDYSALRDFVASTLPMSNDGLREFLRQNNSLFLRQLLDWSELADKIFMENTDNIAPFDGVKDTLKYASQYADIMVVSSAATEGLERDWGNAGLLDYVSLVAGQEAGSKSEQLAAAVYEKYDPDKVLMIGDAPGDIKAALSVKAHFYPIVPKHEEESWQKLRNTYMNEFLQGSYSSFEKALINEFEKTLPPI